MISDGKVFVKALFNCIIIVILINNIHSAHASETLLFNTYKQEDGLSSSTVFDIHQDRMGFLWFATDDGLSRFDGKHFQVFRYDELNTNSISNNRVFVIHEDLEGFLWLGTSSGLNRLNTKTGKFTRYLHNPADEKSIAGDFVTNITEDLIGRIWVASRYSGISILDKQRSTFMRLNSGREHKFTIDNNAVYSLYSDRKGHIIVATEKEITSFDVDSSGKITLSADSGFLKKLNELTVTYITDDNSGTMWLATNKKIISVNIEQQDVVTYTLDENEEIKSKNIEGPFRILVDSNKDVWVATFGAGLYRLRADSKNFERVVDVAEKTLSSENSYVLSLFEDFEGNVWFAVEGEGVYSFNHDSSIFNYVQIPVKNNFPRSNKIQSMHQSENSDLWIGTNSNGLIKYTINSKDIQVYDSEVNSNFDILHHPIMSVKSDPDKGLWLAIYGIGITYINPKNAEIYVINKDYDKYLVGLEIDKFENIWAHSYSRLYKYNTKTGLLKAYKNHEIYPKGNDNTYVRQIKLDNKGNLLVLSGNGLYQYDENSDSFLWLTKDIELSELTTNDMLTVYQDPESQYWIGTRNGLLSFDETKKSIQRHNLGALKGVSSNFTFNVTTDSAGSVWAKTASELIEFNPDTYSYKVYSKSKGLLGVQTNTHNRFLAGTLELLKDEKLAISGNGGFYLFNPLKKLSPLHNPKTALTRLFINQIESTLNEFQDDSKIDYDEVVTIPFANEITLEYDEANFTIAFATLSFTSPKLNQNRYQLEGFDDSWQRDEFRSGRANYTNISPGNYLFKVVGAGSDGEWSNEIRSLRITIRPPYWLTWWAYSLYIIVIISIIYFTFRFRINQIALKNQKYLSGELIKLDKLKDSFLANTSHELRTPLQGIIGISESIKKEKVNKSITTQLDIVIASGKRLASLVNDILDYSKLQGGILKIDKKPVDISSAVNCVLNVITPLLNRKGLKLINDIIPNSSYISGDFERVQQILFNIIGNAIKYTDEGYIKISCKPKGGFLEIKVEDTGLGIKELDLARIFEPFEQSQSMNQRELSGTGIGLSLTKQLVELHGGTIQVSSELNKGTQFIFSLPRHEQQPILEDTKTTQNKEASLKQQEGIKTSILIVDDNDINLMVLKGMLKNKYTIYQARRGVDAIDLIKQQSDIELAIVDIQMPGMSGFQLCEKIQQLGFSNKIQFIMLSGSKTEKDVLNAKEIGAKYFLEKPVNKKALNHAIFELLKS